MKMVSTTPTVPADVAIARTDNRVIRLMEIVWTVAVQTSKHLCVKVCMICNYSYFVKTEMSLLCLKMKWTNLFHKSILSDCKDGFYNSNCSAECGKCLNGEICHKTSGLCVTGCQAHFVFPFCEGCWAMIFLCLR